MMNQHNGSTFASYSQSCCLGWLGAFERKLDMKHTLRITTAVVIASLAFASAARADSWDMESSHSIERTLRHFQGKRFDIRYIHNWKHFSDRTTGPISVPQRSPSAVKHIQASIASNRTLVRALRARGVDFRTIVNADQAADGSMTFYIR
jgi:hypothetical protein